MTPQRWREVGELFARALDQPSETRAAWLTASGATADVRREVEALLAAHTGADGFLDAPAAETTIGPRDELLPPGLQPGAMLGAYRLVRVLGRGGMGVVFEAEDTRLHRRVALKAVSTLGGTGAEEQRLRREARAAAALVHPNVATVYALEEIDGRAYIASEYLDGETLREVVRRGPLPRDEALGIALGLASGLEAAHRQGIVHRDLKPENVLRLSDGRVKILDFGLAHLEGDARQLRSGSRLTLHGLVVGTPGYMAPEQLLGAPLDGRADQFALGIVLAEMLAGVHPFEAPSLAATIARVLAADGVVSSSEVSLPPDIAVVVQRLTRQRADDRYATTGEVVAALAACQAGAAALPAPDRPIGRTAAQRGAADRRTRPPAGVRRSGGGGSTRPPRRPSTGGWSGPPGSCTATSAPDCRGSSAAWQRPSSPPTSACTCVSRRRCCRRNWRRNWRRPGGGWQSPTGRWSCSGPMPGRR